MHIKQIVLCTIAMGYTLRESNAQFTYGKFIQDTVEVHVYYCFIIHVILSNLDVHDSFFYP